MSTRPYVHVHSSPTLPQDYVKITFQPDLKRFNMDSLDEDTVNLLSKRAYDMAGVMGNKAGAKLSVSLNGEKINVKSFKDYVGLFEGINMPDAYEKVGDRWEVGVATAKDGAFQQVSFVNSICTSKGGGHVNYIADQVAAHLVKAVKKKNKSGTDVKPAMIKNHLCVFVNCLIENPTFDSQTKENLTSRPKSFGSKCELPEKFLKQVDKSGIVDTILSWSNFKAKQQLGKKGGAKKLKLTGIAKLDDANHAGGAKSKDCTLIITEGDSAKSLAMSGLSVVGRDFYGVFPLKGKPLNVRDANHTQVIQNEEIKNVVDIMGLKYHTVYDEESVKTLRYGHLMIMADQDHDGSHIKGLVINFLHHYWPSLLDIPGFLQQFITPIVRATSKNKKFVKTFFTLPEYENWLADVKSIKSWDIKYYKGLGTSTAAEGKEYFSNLKIHEIDFSVMKDNSEEVQMEVAEGEEAQTRTLTGSDVIDMAFSKNRVEDRKIWLNNLKADTFLNYSTAHETGVKYTDFVNKELILFSQADNARSIPHVFDGFKPSQRKILFSCFKRKLRGEIKVAQLAGYVSEHSAYHHGEMSLTGAIIGMAQSFVGSNNLNLMTPSGQFGTRRMGGKDAASPRYVFTKLEDITRTIFHPDDDQLLNYLDDDGKSIEPQFYMPVIPLVLVNGSDGIGTGWSSNTPQFSAREIIANLRRMIGNEPITPLTPSYEGYHGDIIAEDGKRAGCFKVHGKITRTDDTTIVITELPIKKWTQDYKVFLETMMSADVEGAKKDAEKKKKEDAKKKAASKKKADYEGSDSEDEDVVVAGSKEDTKAKAAAEKALAKGVSADIKDFKENHTDSTVSFTITAESSKIDEWEKGPGGLMNKFKLTGSISTSNMNLFDAKGRISKYDTPEAILKTFFNTRLDYYVKRKAALLKVLTREHSTLANKARFVEAVCDGSFKISNRKKAELLKDLQKQGYASFEKEDKKKKQASADGDSDDEDSDDEDVGAVSAKGYDYLLGMKLWSLSREKVEKLKDELESKQEELTTLEGTAPHQLWWSDLNDVEDALDVRDAAIAQAESEERAAQNKAKKNQKSKNAKADKAVKKKGKKAKGWDSEDEESDEDMAMMEESDDDMANVVVHVKKEKKAKKVINTSSKYAPAPHEDPEVEEVISGVHLFTATVKVEKVKEEKSSKEMKSSPSSESLEGVETLAENMTLMERLGSKMKKEAAKKPVKEKKVVVKKAVVKKEPKWDSDAESDFDEIQCPADMSMMDMDAFDAAEMTPVKSKKAVVKKDKKPATKPAAKKEAKKAIVKKAPVVKKKAKKDESEDELGSDSDSEDDCSAAPAARAPRGGGRAKSAVNYAVMNGPGDSDGEEDDESDFE